MGTDAHIENRAFAIPLNGRQEVTREILADGKIKGLLIMTPTSPGLVGVEGATPPYERSNLLFRQSVGMHKILYNDNGDISGHMCGFATNTCERGPGWGDITTSYELNVTNVINVLGVAQSVSLPGKTIPSLYSTTINVSLFISSNRIYVRVRSDGVSAITSSTLTLNVIVVYGEDAEVEIIKCDNSAQEFPLTIRPDFTFSFSNGYYNNGTNTLPLQNPDVFISAIAISSLSKEDIVPTPYIIPQTTIIKSVRNSGSGGVVIQSSNSELDIKPNDVDDRIYNWVPSSVRLPNGDLTLGYATLYTSLSPSKVPLNSLMFAVSTGDLEVFPFRGESFGQTTAWEERLPNNISSYFFVQEPRIPVFDQDVFGIGFKSLRNDSNFCFNQHITQTFGSTANTSNMLWNDISGLGTTVYDLEYEPENSSIPDQDRRARLYGTQPLNFLVNHGDFFYGNRTTGLALTKSVPSKSHRTNSNLTPTPNVNVFTFTTISSLSGKASKTHSAESMTAANITIDHMLMSMLKTDRATYTIRSLLRDTISVIKMTSSLLYQKISLPMTTDSHIIPFQIQIDSDIKVNTLTGVSGSTNISLGERPPNQAYCKNFNRITRNC